MSSKYSKRLLERAIIPPRFDMLNHKGASAPNLVDMMSRYHTPFSEADDHANAALVVLYGLKYAVSMLHETNPDLGHLPYGGKGGNQYKAYRMYPRFKKLNYF